MHRDTTQPACGPRYLEMATEHLFATLDPVSDLVRLHHGAAEFSDVEALLELVHPPAWHADALCKEYIDVDFFATSGTASEPAKKVCRACLVITECRAWSFGQGPELH